MDNKDIGIKTDWGIIESISSNNFQYCVDCNIEITKENDSGWEGFTKDGKTQPICKICDSKRFNIKLKE